MCSLTQLILRSFNVSTRNATWIAEAVICSSIPHVSVGQFRPPDGFDPIGGKVQVGIEPRRILPNRLWIPGSDIYEAVGLSEQKKEIDSR